MNRLWGSERNLTDATSKVRSGATCANAPQSKPAVSVLTAVRRINSSLGPGYNKPERGDDVLLNPPPTSPRAKARMCIRIHGPNESTTGSPDLFQSCAASGAHTHP